MEVLPIGSRHDLGRQVRASGATAPDFENLWDFPNRLVVVLTAAARTAEANLTEILIEASNTSRRNGPPCVVGEAP